ncbi:MAG: metallophosphoesterase family protein, partial [Planctomycetota bacterium]
MIDTYTLDPDFQTIALLSGDWIGTDTEADWTNIFFPTNQPNLVQFKKDVPISGCRGNHEGGGAVFAKYYPFPYESAFYFSFDYGPLHVAVVDQYTTYTSGSAQYNWLVNDLANSTKEWKVIVLHQPGWSAAGGHANDVTVQNTIQPLCLQYGVDIIFGGHNHYYSRHDVDGVQHITTGGGGAPLRTPDMGSDYLVVAESVLHHCEITISGNQLDLDARRGNGSILDSFTLLHSSAPRFTSDPINEIPVAANVAYSSSIADNAMDPQGDPMTFSKVDGPAWLTVASNGDLSGTPGTGDVGPNSWTVQVDAIDGSDQATLNISVYAEGALYQEDFSVDPGYVSANLSVIGAVGSTYTYFTFDEYNGTPDIGVTTGTGVLHFDSDTIGTSARSRGVSVFIDTSAAVAGTYTVSFDVSNWVPGTGTAGFSVREGSGLDTSYMELDNADNNDAGTTPNFRGPAASTLLGSTWGGGTPGTGITGNGTVSFEVTLTEAGQAG